MMPVPGGRGAQNDLPGAVPAVDVVVQGAAFRQRHADQRALRRFRRLADRLRHLARLAVAEADAAALVADDDEGGEAEAPSALHHLGDAVDMDKLVDEFAVALFAAFPDPCRDPACVPVLTFRPSDPRYGVCPALPRDQNSSPPSRAASASALTRPWKR